MEFSALEKVSVLILNFTCAILALSILFSEQIPVIEKNGKYLSYSEIFEIDIKTNELSFQAIDIAKNNGDIDSMEAIFKDRVEQFNSSIVMKTNWDNLVSTTSAKLLLLVLALQVILLLRRK
jgi:hypothetical protein